MDSPTGDSKVPAHLEQLVVLDEEWPWPNFPKDAPRNVGRFASEQFTGWEGDFLDFFRSSGIQRAAAQNVKVSQQTIKRRIKSDPAFREAYEEAREMAYELLEAAAFNRAVRGVTKTKNIYYNGEVIGQEVEVTYSDALLKFLMQANMPQKYGEKITHELNVTLMRKEVERIAAQEGLDVEEVWTEARQLAQNNL